MDPNSNNQQNNPITAQQPLQQTQSPIQDPQFMQAPAAPAKKSGGKGTILLIIILLLIIGMSFFIMFTKNQANKSPEAMTIESNTQPTTSPAVLSPTPVETTVSLDNLDIVSPDADIQGLEESAQGL